MEKSRVSFQQTGMRDFLADITWLKALIHLITAGLSSRTSPLPKLSSMHACVRAQLLSCV